MAGSSLSVEEGSNVSSALPRSPPARHPPHAAAVLAANDSHCALVQRIVRRRQEPLPWEITARRLRPPPHAPPMGTALGDDTGQGWKASVWS